MTGSPDRRLLLASLAGLALPAGTASALPPAPAIHVRAAGQGNRTWVLLHAFGMSGRLWEARAPALAAEHGVSIWSVDLPSHGRSRIVDRFDYFSAAAAIADNLRQQSNTFELFVGASSGGLVALKLGARFNAPVAAIGVGHSFSARNIADMRATAASMPAQTDAFITPYLEQGAPQRAAIQRHFGDLASLGEAPLLTPQECSALAGRTLIINGGSDNFFSRDSAHALADAIPRSTLQFITGAGHLEPLAPPHRDFTWASIAAFGRTRG